MNEQKNSDWVSWFNVILSVVNVTALLIWFFAYVKIEKPERTYDIFLGIFGGLALMITILALGIAILSFVGYRNIQRIVEEKLDSDLRNQIITDKSIKKWVRDLIKEEIKEEREENISTEEPIKLKKNNELITIK